MPEAWCRVGQAGGIGVLGAAPPGALGLREVPCHFKGINGHPGSAVTTGSLDSG
jgi:hypothetical protein